MNIDEINIIYDIKDSEEVNYLVNALLKEIRII